MATAKKGLGKGLDSLIADKGAGKVAPAKPAVEKKPVEGEVLMMDINKVEPNRNQPRTHFDEDKLQEIADSIKLYGILEPLLVVKRDDYYMIVAGERRWRGAKIAGKKEVPVIIKELTDREIVEISIIENVQRDDLNPIEEALGYKRLLDEFDMKQDDVAERVSKSRTAVTNALRLLKLDARVQQMVIEEMLSSGHARTLIPIEDSEVQYATAQKIFDEKLSVRDTEKLVKTLLSDKKPAAPEKRKLDPQTEAIYRDLEEQLKRVIGTKVTINAKDEKSGKIEIEYYSADNLDHLIDMLRTVQK